MPSVSDFIFGTKGKTKQLGLNTSAQDELLALIQEGLTKGEGGLADIFGGFNQEEFEQGVVNPALKNFQEKILPMLQEKFISNNQTGASARGRQTLQAGTDLQSQLAQLMYQAQQQQKQNKIAGVQQALGKQGVENTYKPGTKGIWQGFAEGVGQGAGTIAGAAIAG